MSKVTLRPITVADVDDLVTIVSNPDVTRYIPDLIQDRDILSNWISTLPPFAHEFMVIVDDHVIGECSLDSDGEIGLMLLPEYWRQGYGTDTVSALIEIAREMGLDKVTAQTDEQNEACVGLLRSMGFTRTSVGWRIPDEDWDRPLSEYQTLIVFSRKV